MYAIDALRTLAFTFTLWQYDGKKKDTTKCGAADLKRNSCIISGNEIHVIYWYMIIAAIEKRTVRSARLKLDIDAYWPKISFRVLCAKYTFI